jgi:hypothetical protein
MKCERVSATVCRAAHGRAGTSRGEDGELGYHKTAEANETTTPQIPAQIPSDNSKVAIKDTPVYGR